MVGAKACVWFLVLGLAVAMHGGDGAPASAPAPAPAVDCSSALTDLVDCLSFVQDGSNETKPMKSCCSGLKTVVKAHVACLCDAFKQGADFGVNMTKALTLPSACGVSTPSISNCGSIAAVPAAAPVMSPWAGGPTSATVGGVPSPTPGASAAANWIPSSSHFASVAFALCFYYWL